jgi:hypothetical protein
MPLIDAADCCVESEKLQLILWYGLGIGSFRAAKRCDMACSEAFSVLQKFRTEGFQVTQWTISRLK